MNAFTQAGKPAGILNQAAQRDEEIAMNRTLLSFYEAIERASADMLDAARQGEWDEVVRLEGACAVLISQLKSAAQSASLRAEDARLKSRIMQRILLNDAEIRHLAEPWLDDLDMMVHGRSRTVH
jgi:flagellar protein FliT